MILGNPQKYVSTNRSLFSVKLYRPVSVIIWQLIVYQTLFKSTINGAVPSQELRTVLCVVVMLLRVNFKFWNRFTCSKGPIKRTGKVCGDSQDLKSGNPWQYDSARNLQTSFRCNLQGLYGCQYVFHFCREVNWVLPMLAEGFWAS